MLATIRCVPQWRRRETADLDLENRIANFLDLQKVPHGCQVKADAHLGTVVVSGQLESKHEKWLCLETCRRVAGVVQLIDRIVLSSNSVELEEMPEADLLQAA